jgi:hypothetical protein
MSDDVEEVSERAPDSPQLFGCSVTEQFDQTVIYPPRQQYVETM